MIGETIKKYRKDMKLTQDELGGKVGVSGVAIMRYEKNQREPSLEVLQRIAEVFNATVSDILYSDEESKAKATDQIEKTMAMAFYTLDEDRMPAALKQILLGDFTDTEKELSKNENLKEVFKKKYSREFLRSLPPDEFEKCFEGTSLDIFERAVIFSVIRDASITEFRVVNFYEYVNRFESVDLSRPYSEFEDAYTSLYKRMGYDNPPPYMMDKDRVMKLIKIKHDVIKALNGIIFLINGVNVINNDLAPGEYEKIYYIFERLEKIIIMELNDLNKG